MSRKVLVDYDELVALSGNAPTLVGIVFSEVGSLADDPAALRERVRLAPHQEEWVRAAADEEGRTFASMVRYIVQCWVVDQAGFIDDGAAERGDGE